MSSLSILLAQINPVVGAIDDNATKIIKIIEAHQRHHDLIVFPELALTGYPLEDLLYRPSLHQQVEAALERITAVTNDCHVIVGHPTRDGERCYNSASVLHQKRQQHLYHKQHLPNYGVFDEKRYFESGPATPCVFTLKTVKIGLCICEDLWHPGPIEQLMTENIDVMVSINASPFDITKYQKRLDLLKRHTCNKITALYVNLVGGQDELVFDGRSFAMNHAGDLCASAPAFEEYLLPVTLQADKVQGDLSPTPHNEALIYQALQCGLRDYIHKNNFSGALIGLSGGIDSALVLAIAVDALGPENVHAVLMPSRYTATMSEEDALSEVRALNVSYSHLPIEPAFQTLLATLATDFATYPVDITEENLQARIRGLLLMALSNKTGKLVLSTSNKSEVAVGYSTLYGDMCGGFSVLKDVYKTMVYKLANYRNTLTSVIPQRVITRPPSAELAPNQTDQDSLPAYDVLDAILESYIEHHLDSQAIVQQGFSAETVTRIIQMIKRNEYKRRQAAPGVKITACAFGRDWRHPITSQFRADTIT